MKNLSTLFYISLVFIACSYIGITVGAVLKIQHYENANSILFFSLIAKLLGVILIITYVIFKKKKNISI